jgi:RNA polymerase sigma factor for flagellar operon FliA
MEQEHPPDSDPDKASELALWRAYVAGRDPQLRIELIDRYLALARRIAGYLFAQRVDRNAQFDDYLQAARLGLLEALDRFDPERGVGFATFATYRIRGAILAEVERSTEAAAVAIHRSRREHERVADLVENHPGGSDAFERLVDITVGLALGYALEDSGVAQNHIAADPYRAVELKRLQERLRLIVEALPARERAIVRWHYFEYMDFKLVGEALGLSKGRISQLHVRALQLLRKGLEAIGQFDVSV